MPTARAWDRLDLLGLLERHDPARVALTLDGDERTYGELVGRARAVASTLTGPLGVRSGQRVALLCRNRLEYLEVELAVSHAEGVLVAMSWRYTQQERIAVLRRCGATVAVVDPEFVAPLREAMATGALPELRHLISFGAEYDALIHRGMDAAAPTHDDRDFGAPHEIIFTSGTTGAPKGAVWTTGSVLFNALQQIIDFGLTRDSVTYVSFDQNYIGGRHQFVWGILHQGGVVHLKQSGGFDPVLVAEAIARHRVTHMLMVPTMLHDVVGAVAAELDTSSLQMIMTGGAPVSLELLEEATGAFPSARVVQVYGLTEGGGSVTFVPPSHLSAKLGSAGCASTHASVRIDGANADGIGEIEVLAPTLCAGYWDDPEATAALFHDGWLRTGDLGRIDGDGFLFVTGRKKELIISGGMNIFPSEIEAVLERHPAVRAAAVFGMPDERWGESVCAAVELEQGGSATADELIALCREALSSHKKPTRIEFLTLPRTSSGKIAKRELPALVEALQ